MGLAAAENCNLDSSDDLHKQRRELDLLAAITSGIPARIRTNFLPSDRASEACAGWALASWTYARGRFPVSGEVPTSSRGGRAFLFCL